MCVKYKCVYVTYIPMNMCIEQFSYVWINAYTILSAGFETSEDLCIFFMPSLLVHPLSSSTHLYQLKPFHSNHKMRETIIYKLDIYIYLCVHIYHCTTYVTSGASLNPCFILNCSGYMYSVYCEW